MMQNLRVNQYGLFGFILIIVILGVRMSQVIVPADAPMSPIIYQLIGAVFDPYVLGAIIPYIFVGLIVSSRLNSKAYVEQRLSSPERLLYQRIFIAAQVAFICVILGLLLGLDSVLWKIVFYFISIGVGFLVAFLLVSSGDDSPSNTPIKKSDELEF